MSSGTKVYIPVEVVFNELGAMRPVAFTWENGLRFEIDRIIDVRPSFSARAGGQGDRYTVRVCGQERYLFFEHNPRCEDPRVGRWFVERVSGREACV